MCVYLYMQLTNGHMGNVRMVISKINFPDIYIYIYICWDVGPIVVPLCVLDQYKKHIDKKHLVVPLGVSC